MCVYMYVHTTYKQSEILLLLRVIRAITLLYYLKTETHVKPLLHTLISKKNLNFKFSEIPYGIQHMNIYRRKKQSNWTQFYVLRVYRLLSVF